MGIYERKVDMVEPLKAVLISTPMGGLNKGKGRRQIAMSWHVIQKKGLVNKLKWNGTPIIPKQDKECIELQDCSEQNSIQFFLLI